MNSHRELVEMELPEEKFEIAMMNNLLNAIERQLILALCEDETHRQRDTRLKQLIKMIIYARSATPKDDNIPF